jgi:hypothetical protein
VDQSHLLPTEADLNLKLGSYQSDERCSPPLTCSCTSVGSVVLPSPHLDSPGGQVLPPLLTPCRIISPGGPGNKLSNKGGEKRPSSPQSWQQASQKCCRNLNLRYGTLRWFSRKQYFIVPAQTQQTHVQSLSPENQRVSPHIALKVGYRSKKQDLSHTWLHAIL